ncbi:hypothetical protein H0H92_008659 [Tricholoma furcatifolium]|nr:hypothetical protein H0H92_008659 [Tricholoma furcatifolium]
MLLAIYNPVCGDRTAKDFFDNHVVPLLEEHGKTIDALVGTQHAGYAGEYLLQSIQDVQGEVTVVLGSGDGTLHEIINFLSSNATAPITKIHFVLVPCGTANALYASLFPPIPDQDNVSYRLQSLKSYCTSSHTIPLTLAIATLSSPPNEKKQPHVRVSSVVTSTSLHASILHDSEALREKMPGIERFKVAAQINSSKWYKGYAKLLPASETGKVQIYNPSIKTFMDHPESSDVDPIVHVDGPFSYFLSTVNIDRLEPAFRITPLARTIPPVEASCEVVLIRPLRDPSISLDNEESRAFFVPKLWAILGAAYQDGAHINLRYGVDGDVIATGVGPVVVEYIRCGGWEWIPDDLDNDAHLLCSDGEISFIEKGGRALCSAATPQNGVGFAVYV